MTRARRRDLAGWVAGVLTLVTTATTFLGWGRSGQRVRTSYELVDVADRAGVLADDAAWAAPLWFLGPAACGAVLVALAAHRRALAGALTTTLGALVGTGAVLVDRSPLVAEPAVGVAVVLGAATALSGVAVLVTARKETAG
jgi:hypothetical protein